MAAWRSVASGIWSWMGLDFLFCKTCCGRVVGEDLVFLVFSCFLVFSKASSGVLLFTLLLATFDQSSSLNRGCAGAYLCFLSVCHCTALSAIRCCEETAVTQGPLLLQVLLPWRTKPASLLFLWDEKTLVGGGICLNQVSLTSVFRPEEKSAVGAQRGEFYFE